MVAVGLRPQIGKRFGDMDTDSVSCFWTRIILRRFVSARVCRRLFCPHWFVVFFACAARKNKNPDRFCEIQINVRQPQKIWKNVFFVRALVLRSSSCPVTHNKTIRSPRCGAPSLLALWKNVFCTTDTAQISSTIWPFAPLFVIVHYRCANNLCTLQVLWRFKRLFF